jgi:Heterokaryon incompatibility protein (HET)
MRLLEDVGHGNLKLVEKHDNDIPRYAILSHTWGADGDEVTFRDIMEGTGRDKIGREKIEFCRAQAARDGLQHFWVDTCCIDKSSSAELSEAINSMFRWYRNADKCYVYLPDVLMAGEATGMQSSSTVWKAEFRKSRWFTRGWTLQELIAPASVEFFSREHDRLGSKQSLEGTIHEITGIPIEALRGEPLLDFEIEERFSWADHRETKRQEDKAYSLLGIFNIFMPLLYGEGRDNAFVRLRKAISNSSNRKRTFQVLTSSTNSTSAPMKQPETPLSPSSTVPFRRDADFVDRRASQDGKTLLEQVEQQCAAPAARVALVGIGGAG